MAVLHVVLKYRSAGFFTEMLWDQLHVTISLAIYEVPYPGMVAWDTLSLAMGSITAAGLRSPLPTVSWEQLWEHFSVTCSQKLSVVVLNSRLFLFLNVFSEENEREREKESARGKQ